MSTRRIVALIGVAVALHLNYWLWDSDRLVVGLPINLSYHVLLTLLLSVAMLALVRWYWPTYLGEREPGEPTPGGQGPGDREPGEQGSGVQGPGGQGPGEREPARKNPDEPEPA